MKKFISAIMVLAITATAVFGFAGCAKKADAFKLVMITDGATISDGGYNQSAWNGIESFASENDMTCRYYQPKLEGDGTLSADTIKNYVDLAVKDGAEFVVLPGQKFAAAIGDIAPEYKDTKFVLIDAKPVDANGEAMSISNVMTIDFDVLQAGFLAGFTSVNLGNTKLGYLGSVSDAESALYGSGYVQGAGYAADKSKTPVYMDYADYDAENLNYDYSFKIKPVYVPVTDAKEQTFKVNVVDGYGSGVYTDGENVTVTAINAPEGKAFDHWECKSDTEGVRDSKVNISSKSKTSMNLLVGDCDCTITAVWKDVKTVPVNVHKAYGELSNIGDVVETYYVPENSSLDIVAPTADSGRVFSEWTAEEGNIEEIVSESNNAWTKVSVTDKPVDLIAIYDISDAPTFDVTVENGTGSGAYRSGDYVQVVADAPQDGYMFYKWENIDNQGLSTGIAMENEYCYITSFDMVDRYSSIVEAMYDDGDQVIFGGGNSQSDSIFTATWNYDYQVYAFGSGIDQNGWGNCLASVVKDYGAATKLALADFKGGTNLTGDCSNNCIYTINIADDNEDYKAVYDSLANGKIAPAKLKGDIRTVNNSKCLTLNYWIK